MKIVIDTNILIRVLISPDGYVSDLFYPLKQEHDLIISYTSLEEINGHKTRLIKTSGLKRSEFELLLASLLSEVTVIPLEQIPDSVLLRSFMLISGIDYDDVAFVATTLFTQGFLWTSDKELLYGLRKKGFGTVLGNSEIKRMINIK